MSHPPLSAADFSAAMDALCLPVGMKKLGVAVSGGADSLALTLLAAEWTEMAGSTLTAFTVDHGLRPESAIEAAHVHNQLSTRGITHHILHWQPDAKPQANLQAAARDARYRLLAAACRQNGITHLLLGHHQDDQAETFLLRLSRGAGVDGLSAMRPVSIRDGISLLRPLLKFPKAALTATLQARNLTWLEDPSNRQMHFHRARIRHTAMPALSTTGLPSATLAQAAERMARASDFLTQETAKALERCVHLHPEGYITLHMATFRILHPEIALRVLADTLRLMNHDHYRPRFSELEALFHALPEPRTLAGCQFTLRGNHILVFREWEHVAPPLSIAPGEPAIWDGRFMITSNQPLRVGALGKTLPETVGNWRISRRTAWTLPALYENGLENPQSLLHMDNMHPASGAFHIRAFPMAGFGGLGLTRLPV